VIERAQASANAAPGTSASWVHRWAALRRSAYAARMPQSVGAVVVQYPLTSFIKDPVDFVAKIKVPVLMLAGTFDNYKGCC
jgi:pimeloyl-ACP methyl ester carboxylesterase